MWRRLYTINIILLYTDIDFIKLTILYQSFKITHINIYAYRTINAVD